MNDRIALELGRALLRAIIAEQQAAELTENAEAQKKATLARQPAQSENE